MGPTDQIETHEQPLTPEQQANLEVIDKLLAKNKELSGRMVIELGKGNGRFVAFQHALDGEGGKQSLIATVDGFKVLTSFDLEKPVFDYSSREPRDTGQKDIKHIDHAEGVVNHLKHYSVENNDADQYQYEVATGRIKNVRGEYYTDKNPDNEYVAKLMDADQIGSEAIEALILHNRKIAESPEPAEPAPVTPNSQVVKDLDNLLS